MLRWNSSSPNGDDSPVLRFLNEKGGGLHHACYEVADLEQALSEFRSRGSLIVKRPKPAVAFQGRRIAWLLTPEKFLVELLKKAARAFRKMSPESYLVNPWVRLSSSFVAARRPSTEG